jgi:hypothetical protein
VSASCSGGNRIVETFQSPDNVYEVTLKGQSGQPWIPSDDRVLHLSASRNGNPVFSEIELYRAGFLDDSFLDEYPDRSWPHNNVIRFKGYRVRATGCDQLVVRNTSAQEITYLRATLRDLLIFMNITSNTEVAVPVTPFPARTSGFLLADGEFANGNQIDPGSKYPFEPHGRLRYSVEVSSHRTEVTISPLLGTAVPGCND